MLRLLNRHAQEFSDFKKHTWLIKYCTKVLKHPRKHEGELLSYLARAFYCFQALQLDPEGYSARIRVLIDRMCMIDSNILIPCIADGHPSQSSYKEILKKAKELGMKFCVIKETIVEIERAAKWASDLVKENGERSIEVLFASLGEAGYRPNQFLEAHIEYKEDKNISFAGYLSKIFGGLPNSKSIKNVIGKTLEIKSCVKEDLVRFEGERVDNYRRKVKEEIQRKAEETYASRAVTRVETEATVYTMVALWQEIKKEDVEENRCCFISLGGLLNWLAKSATVGIEQCPIVTIDGLYEILRLLESPKEKMDFFEWIKHNYFTASETLLTSRSAKKYFQKIISSAEEEYLENYEEFNKVLDLKLSKSYLEKIPDLERPGFVKSLKTKMDRIKSEAGFQEKYYKKTIEEIKKGKEKAERGQKYWREQARRLMKGKK